MAVLGLVSCGPEGEVPAAGRPLPEGAPQDVDTTDVRLGDVAGQTVYVPVYSHVYAESGARWVDLAVTLSVRNADPDHPIVVTAVRYYDSDGRLVHRYLDGPLRLPPYSSRTYVVEERDRSGGVGANFAVEWRAGDRVSPPVVEAVMISTASGQGISIVSRGEAVRTLRDGVWEVGGGQDPTGQGPTGQEGGVDSVGGP